jgi:hypothetical protein
VKNLDGFPLGVEIESAVGEDAVHIQDQQPDAAGPFYDLFRVWWKIQIVVLTTAGECPPPILAG